MKNILAILALVCFVSVGVYAQGETTSKKNKGGAAPAATTPAPATGGAASSSDAKKTKGGAAAAAPAAPAKATGKMMKGSVVDITAWLMSGNGKVNKDQATKALSSGHTLGFMVGSKVYMVSNADGSSAANRLAALANANVGVQGTAKSKGGYNLILASMIENI